MTDHSTHEIEDLQELVKQIVQLRTQYKQVEELRQQAQAQVNAHATQLLSIKKQITHMRDLLDHCLDTGEDVTTVKLTKSVAEIPSRKPKVSQVESLLDAYEMTWHKAAKTF